MTAQPRYLVRVVETKGLRQRWHVRIESAVNGQAIFVSEKYRDHGYALALAHVIAGRKFDAEVVEG